MAKLFKKGDYVTWNGYTRKSLGVNIDNLKRGKVVDTYSGYSTDVTIKLLETRNGEKHMVSSNYDGGWGSRSIRGKGIVKINQDFMVNERSIILTSDQTHVNQNSVLEDTTYGISPEINVNYLLM